MDDRADVIIVGGGSAGCVLASRLSADPSRRVVLIEAGIDTPPGAVPPEIADSYPMPLFFGDRYVWPELKVTTHRDAKGQPVNRLYEQGRVMGGGSSVNVQAANRGLPRDFNEWESLGARGWGWDGVLPYFRKLETDLDFGGPLHGDSGPMPIRRIRREAWPPFAAAAAHAFTASGLPLREDQNGEVEDGIYPPAFANRDDRRVSAADAYLTAAIRQRANLRILTDTQVLRLLLSARRAEGVVAHRANGSLLTIQGRHVVLAAGALQSPALLLRAGIGPGADLQALGIPVALDRAGVGRNLRDHPALTFCQYLPQALRLPPDFRRASLMALRFSSGLPGAEASDMYLTASARAAWHGLGARLALYFLWCNRPYSVGALRLASPDPDTPAAADFNLLGDARDLARLAAGVRLLMRLVVSPALNPRPGDLFPAGFSPRIKRLSRVSRWNGRKTEVLGRMLDISAPLRRMALGLFMSGGVLEGMADDHALEGFIRRNVFGVWHASGTCRLGDPADPEAVADRDGRVIGSDNLWVADASVMPRLPTANTNIPVIMVAEKISDAMARAI